MKLNPRSAILATALWLAAGCAFAQQPSGLDERVVALKTTLAASQAILAKYEWIETTTVTVKGEVKSRQQQSCYYGLDGKVQKILLTTPPAEKTKPGLRGAIAKNKKAELTSYMQDAIELVKRYVPPDPAVIQAVRAAGNVMIQPLQGQTTRLVFANYYQPKDSLTLEIDLASNRPLKAAVASALGKDPVSLDVQFGDLPGNVVYASRAVLSAPAKNLVVTIENSGHRPANH
jgi:hypothetical protein